MGRLFWVAILYTACKMCSMNMDIEICVSEVPDSICIQGTKCSDDICNKKPNCSLIKDTDEFKDLDRCKKINNTYPVLWGNRCLLINKTIVNNSTNGTCEDVNEKCIKNELIGEHQAETEGLTTQRQRGFRFGGKKIEINTTLKINDTFKIFMEVSNKTCSNPQKRGYTLSCISPKVDHKGETNATFIFDCVKYFIRFEYLENPVIELGDRNSSYYSGGRRLEFQGEHFSHIKHAELSYKNDIRISENCTVKRNTTIECLSPNINTTNTTLSDSPDKITLVLKLDNYMEDIILDYYTVPKFDNARMEQKTIKITGKRLNKAAEEGEYIIIVAGKENCTIKNLEPDYIKCTVQDENIGDNKEIKVTLHKISVTLKLEIVEDELLYILIAVGLIIIPAIFLVSLAVYRRVSRKKETSSYIPTDGCTEQLMSLIVRQGIPFQKPSDYIKRILWTHKPPGNIRYNTQNMSENLKHSLKQFGFLLKNKYFVLPTLKALEKDKSLTQDHKFTYAYHLTLLFSSDLRYFLELCEDLFVHLVSQNKGAKSQKLMLSCSSITEYMILNWLGISMYSYMKENVGGLLYFFTHDLKSHLERMPIDEVTGNSYQYIFEKHRLKKSTMYEEIKIQVEMRGEIKIVSVFTCDSIVQLKKKCLTAFFTGVPVSEIPDVDDVCVEYNRNRIDEFKTKENDKGFTQHLTIDNWNIEEDDFLRLTYSKAPQVTEANADDRYTTLGSPVARITTKSNRKFIHIQEPEDRKTEQPLTKKDFKKIKLPISLEHKLMQLIYKFLESRNRSAPQRCLYNLFKKAAQKNGMEKTWIISSYLIQFCCQFIAEPNILLDINLELYMKKNLEGIKKYTTYTLSRCLKNSFQAPELSKNITAFLSASSNADRDTKEPMLILQDITNDIRRDVSFSEENSLYYLFKMMKNNISKINSALTKEEEASRLQLDETFSTIIEQIEIGQTKRDDSFSF